MRHALLGLTFAAVLAVLVDGFAFVADHALERINKMQLKDRKLVATWGRQGLGPGEFDWVHGVVVDSRGAVYAADTYGQRLQKFVPQP